MPRYDCSAEEYQELEKTVKKLETEVFENSRNEFYEEYRLNRNKLWRIRDYAENSFFEDI